jgi:hypothetical protein
MLRVVLVAVIVVSSLSTRASAQVACGALLRRGEKVTLTADVGPCDGVDAAILVDGGSLDLGGRTVTCADLDGDGDVPIGIVLLGRKATLRNGTIVGCSNGLGLGGDGRHRVTGITARGSADDGVDAIPGADRCRLVDVVAVQNGDDGIQLRSDRNRLVRSVTAENADDGLEVWESGDRNALVEPRSERNGDEGLLLLGARNKVAKPAANDNGAIGIDLTGVANKVTGGSAASNGAYDLANCDGDRVRKTTFTTATPDCQ